MSMMKFFKKDSNVVNPKLPNKSNVGLGLGLPLSVPSNNVVSHGTSNHSIVTQKQIIENSNNRFQAYHWQGNVGKKSSVDDMVLLSKITEPAIADNLHKRFVDDKIYTYIGPVLVAVNPFKQLNYFGEKEIEMYQGAAQYEVPPHIYALADVMYRNMLIDSDNQCVIISGESGAGKTVSAKYIMNYITRISGGGNRVQQVKEIILESNPLLEAFGNAKTTRNNNSSRFGKYIEIQFSRGGEPLGGKISNFLLEKSRVHSLNEGERSFHIFYQLCAGATSDMKQHFGITTPDYYNYLNQSRVYQVEGTNDAKDFQETLKAMSVMGINEETQSGILKVVAAILHMSNITFVENGNVASISDVNYLEYPAFLLGINAEKFGQKITSRVFDSKWGGKSERVDVTLNVEQSQFARDAWTKGLYARLFHYIVETVNSAMLTEAREINIGILDIYGFEIFSRNGFEQFCINYVNEKLQQIFIELTLKSEQEEYQAEGIQWNPISFFNNQVVCDLIESKRPPGIMSLLDDTCATMSAVSHGADDDFRRKMDSQIGCSNHYQPFKDGFTIKHYAGNVSYQIESFCEKNRDVLFVDIIELMQSSSNSFIRHLFDDDVVTSTSKGRPATAGSQIRSQANTLVTTLMQCVPHYIRCIKPNETKKPHDWDEQMAKHQVEYLGLKENIKVKRAGFAYRRPFGKFLHRYAILTAETYPQWKGTPQDGILFILKMVNMDQSQYQIGKTKIFIKDPESLYMLEEYRERKYDHYARVIQKAFKKYYSKQRTLQERMEASDLLFNRKERRSNSLNRNFHGDYIGVESKPGLCSLIPRREKVEFSLTVDKFDRRFRKTKRDLVLTRNYLYLIGRETVKKGEKKGQVMEVIKRKVDLENISQVTMSTYQDDIILIGVKNDFESLLEVRLKTEFITILNRKIKEKYNHGVHLNFSNSFDYHVKKTRWGGGGNRKVTFTDGMTQEAILNSSASTLTVKISHGLPMSSRPVLRRMIDQETRQLANQIRNSCINTSAITPKIAPQQQTAVVVPQEQISQCMFPVAHNPQTVRLRATTTGGAPISSMPPPPPLDPAPANQPTLVMKILNVQKPTIERPKPKIPQVKALFSYDARDVDELTFGEGDLLQLIQEDNSGWWTCRFQGKQGFCPGNYLQKM